MGSLPYVHLGPRSKVPPDTSTYLGDSNPGKIPCCTYLEARKVRKIQCQTYKNVHLGRGETSEPDNHRGGQCSVVLIWPLQNFIVRF